MVSVLINDVIITLVSGETPYKNIDLSHCWEEFLEKLKNGLRLSKPNGCSDDL